MFTPSQVAEMLQIAPSTTRKYAQLYSNHLSESANRKQRKYTDTDIAILKRVCQLRSEGVPLDEISDQLGVMAITEPQDSLLLIPEISQAFEDLRAVIAHLQQQHASYEERIRILEEKNRPFWEKWRRPQG